MDVSFETRLPMASLLRDAREFFGARHGLTARDEGDGVITFSGASGAVRLAAAAASAGAVRVEVNTEALGALVADFRARVAPPPGAFPRRRRLAAGDDPQRYRRLAERQPAPPGSTEAKSAGIGGGLNPG